MYLLSWACLLKVRDRVDVWRYCYVVKTLSKIILVNLTLAQKYFTHLQPFQIV